METKAGFSKYPRVIAHRGEQMKTREQLFEQLTTELKGKTHKIIEEVFSDLVTDYLPWIETDTESNASTIAQRVLEDFLAGLESDEVKRAALGPGWTSEKIRKKIFEELGDELKGQRVLDLEAEVARLRDDLRRSWDRPY
jgi:preprotein translocase subunit SecA